MTPRAKSGRLGLRACAITASVLRARVSAARAIGVRVWPPVGRRPPRSEQLYRRYGEAMSDYVARQARRRHQPQRRLRHVGRCTTLRRQRQR